MKSVSNSCFAVVDVTCQSPNTHLTALHDERNGAAGGTHRLKSRTVENSFTVALQSSGGVNVQEAVPLEELWASIERHAQARQAVAATDLALADRAQQHRAVQKRLLVRLKDKQPGSLAHLDLLMEETFHQLLDLGAHTAHCHITIEMSLAWQPGSPGPAHQFYFPLDPNRGVNRQCRQ